MPTLMNRLTCVFGAALLLATTGCERSTPSTASAPPSAPTPTARTQPGGDAGLPAGVWLTAAPADAKPVAEGKKSAAVGQEVVLSGRIGGGREPFVAGRAIFMLADRTIASCHEKHGPGCATPWDFCCEPKEMVLAGTATVQVVGADGRPLKVGLEGVHGLQPLAEIVVKGKVSSAGENVVVDATGIYVKS